MAKANNETWRTKLEKALQEKNPFTDVLGQVESKTNIKRIYLVTGFAALTAVWLVIGYGAQFFANFIGFLYPAYASIKAIESKEKGDDTKWLTYWVVYSLFSLVEFFTDIFLFWIPFYWLLKCGFMLFCMVPTKWNGSVMIYERIIRPFILKHQAAIDKKLDEAADMAAKLADEGEKLATNVASDATKRYFKKDD